MRHSFSVLLFMLWLPGSAWAQGSAVSREPASEPRRLDLAIGLWAPHAEIVGAAEANHIEGTVVDYRDDLGLTDRPFANLDLTYRMAPHHKARFQYSPIRYTIEDAVLPRDVVFRGVVYPQGTVVTSNLTWQDWHLGYQYDFLVKPWGFVGGIFDVYRTNVKLRMTSEEADKVAPASVTVVPTGGAIARVYATERVALTAQFKAFKMPDKEGQAYGGHLYDFEVSGLARFTRNLGAEAGYRNLDIRHLGKSDSGTMKMNGVYLSAVVSY